MEASARSLAARQEEIRSANALDLAEARNSGMRPALQDRLALDEGRIRGIVEGVRQVCALPDPIGTVTKMDQRPNGLVIGKRRVPLGVIGIIYEARPNVTVDAAALCLKSGNSVLLRGGREAFHSNKALISVMRDALEHVGLPRDCIALVEDTSRDSANELMHLTAYLDLLIPRGGAGLIRSVVENARVPVIQTGVGVCHVYVHAQADLDMAARILYNAKCSRPSVCNAAECVLVQKDIAKHFTGGGPGLSAHGLAAPAEQERGDPRLPADPGYPGRLCNARFPCGLGYGIRRLYSGGEGGLRL